MKLTPREWIHVHRPYWDVFVILIIACGLIWFSIGITIYDSELTDSFERAAETGIAIKWYDKYYFVELSSKEISEINAVKWSFNKTIGCANIANNSDC